MSQLRNSDKPTWPWWVIALIVVGLATGMVLIPSQGCKQQVTADAKTY